MQILSILLFVALSFGESSFRVRLTEDLGTLDWNYGEVNPEIVQQMMEGLFRTDHFGKPQKAVAQSFRWSNHKTQLDVVLAKRQWSDGKKLCASHFVDSWNRLLSKEFASPYAHFAHGLKSFSAQGCEKLSITFHRPSPEAPALLAHSVFFPIRLDQTKLFREGKGLAVNGPFRVANWELNQRLSLERNPRYDGKKPALEKVEFLFIPEDSTAKILFDQKKLDWVKDVPLMLREKNQGKLFPTFITFYFGVNLAKVPSENLRRALSQSLNRGELGKILGPEYVGTKTWLAPADFFGVKFQAPKVDWEAAKKEAQNTKLLLRVYAKSAHRLLAEWAQGQWEKKLGVRVPLEVQEGKVYWKEITVDSAPIFLSGVTAPYAHPRAFLQEFLSTSTANWTGWRSPTYDQAVEGEKFGAAEKLLADSGVVIPLYNRFGVALVQPQWKGFFMNPLGQVFLGELHP